MNNIDPKALIEFAKRNERAGSLNNFNRLAREHTCEIHQPPCHQLTRELWCDRDGPGGFMGHTCQPR
jgi:hypothetical protein